MYWEGVLHRTGMLIFVTVRDIVCKYSGRFFYCCNLETKTRGRDKCVPGVWETLWVYIVNERRFHFRRDRADNSTET